MTINELITILTPRRVTTILLATLGHTLSRITKKPVVLSLPWAISIEPASICNLRCPECPTGMRTLKRETGLLSLENFRQWVSQIRHHTTSLTLYFQGEPLLNSQLPEMIKIASQAGMYTIISTNAQMLTQSLAGEIVAAGLSKIIISLDGVTQKTYEKYRKQGFFDIAKENTYQLREAIKSSGRKTPRLVIQFIVFRHNEHELQDIRKLAFALGADELEIKTAQHYHLDRDCSTLTSLEKYRRYRQNKKGEWVLKGRIRNHCARIWNTSVITWDGKVVPCCYDKDATYTMGSLTKEEFRKIWFGENYRNFRKKILRNKKEIAICQNCIG